MPEPSQLKKLDQLPETSAGIKVRFLGCVHSRDTNNVHLTLRDHYPSTAKDTPTILVLVDAIKDSLNHELLAVGSWLNVIGYVRSRPNECKVSRQAQVAFVEAIVMWSAGAIQHNKYQAAVADFQQSLTASASAGG
ncbi:hypothetical protein LTR62_001527 [Meristemomyces frigidus]|uniref:CST complex subunit Ten1 n=1 Tax=Meristemomyces frigidus TaxID=1508187 RepID=A0AAN7YSL8_9PEZI|nr:hypothetical protein LTR62_001527 [Meristemomyces frigidus]